MICLFKAEAFRDFEEKPSPATFMGNGEIILNPSECYYSADVNGSWQLDMLHPMDPEGRYTFIEEDDVLVVDCKVAREQSNIRQAFRIRSVKPTESNKSISVIAYPIAWESIFDCPIDSIYIANCTADDVIDRLYSTAVNDAKYTLDSHLGTTEEQSIYISDSNLQELLNGDQEGTFKNLFNSEFVYDNYTYRIYPIGEIGNTDADMYNYKIDYGFNMTGFEMETSTTDLVTRIYPHSYEGWWIRGNKYVQSSRVSEHPYVYAKSVTYDDIKLVDIRDYNDTDPAPWTDTQLATQTAKAKIAGTVTSLSRKYLLKARDGDWDHPYKDSSVIRSNNPHEPDTPYDMDKDRYSLPFGYIFYSYNDAMGVLADKVIHAEFEGGNTLYSPDDQGLVGYISNENEPGLSDDELISVTGDNEEYMVFTDENFRTLIQDAIKEGFKWCETTEIAAWDWRYDCTYNDPTFNFLKSYHWIQDMNGWFYGDGNGHYIRNAWVEDDAWHHYWVDERGYWDYQYDDFETWRWWAVGEKWWYGTQNEDGTPKNYAAEQYIKEAESGNWYWFNGDGWFVDGTDKKWWYGTKDSSDIVQFRYHKVGNHIWWFDSAGYISDTLAYLDNYEWRTDETGNYYGDGSGHWFSNAWVEDSSSSHRWLDEDGYEDEDKKDTEEWTWHGSWENGWWYGSDEEEEDEEEEENSSNSSSTSTSTKTKDVLKRIKNICDAASGYTRDSFITAVSDELTGISYSKSSSLGKIDTILDEATGKSKTYLVIEIEDVIDSSGYDFDSEDPEDETASSPSGDTNVTTDSAKNYVKNQFLYISENKTWYWFDEQGYMTAAWLVDDNWEWHQDSLGWYYGDSKGSYPKGQWMKINSKWYFFGLNGYADETTDDFEDSKDGDSNNATYDSNREGIGSVSNQNSIDDVVYDRDREGVRAWIQDEFVKELYVVVKQQWDYLYGIMESQLKAYAEYELSCLDQPAVSITVDMAQLSNTINYERFAFLKDLYLGDRVYFNYSPLGISGELRVTSIKKDCILDDVAEVSFQTLSYHKSNNKLVMGLSNTTSSKGTIVTYTPEEAIEDGYGGFIKTGYGVDLTTL